MVKRRSDHSALLRAAVIGTERMPLDEAVKAELAAFAPLSESDPARALLDALAVGRLARRAGFAPAASGLPPLSPCPPETLRPCPPEAARDLQQILQGKYAEALPEFLSLLAQAKMVLPPESLPELFNRSIGDTAIRQAVRPLMGERGRWLLVQNPVWQVLETAPPAVKTEKPDKKTLERQKQLTELLGDAWEKEINGIETAWSGVLLSAFLLRLNELAPGRWSMQHEYLRPLLQHAAYRCKLSDAEAARTLHTPSADVSLYFWQREMERFFRIAAFRQAFHEHIGRPKA